MRDYSDNYPLDMLQGRGKELNHSGSSQKRVYWGEFEIDDARCFLFGHFRLLFEFLFMVALKLAHKLHRSCLSHLGPGGRDSSESISDVFFSLSTLESELL